MKNDASEGTALITATKPLSKLRFDNIGSLIRPPELVAAMEDYTRGRLDAGALRSRADEAIREVVAEQERRGYPVIVDGEFRRRVFTESFSLVEGLADWEEHYATRALAIDERDAERDGRWSAASHELRVAPSAPLRLLRNVPAEQFAFLQALTDVPAKATLVGPERIFQTLDVAGPAGVYSDPWELLDAVVAVQREIIAGLRDAGCRYVHIDAPGFTSYVDAPSLERIRRRGFDPAELMRRAIDAENAVIAGFDDVTFGIHLCRGNQRGHWHREGPYDAIAEQLFASLEHERLLLEYDTERAGTFAPLRFVPADKVAVLGLVTTKDRAVERADELRRRIDEASAFLDVDAIAISPQCGFESSAGGAVMSVDEQWRKLDVCMEVERQTWA